MPMVASRLQSFFEERTDGELRSIVTYDGDDVDVVFIRDDVATEYTTDELRTAINESRMESLYAPVYEHAFSQEHGDLECMVNCFEEVVELNFALDDGVGAAVALDADALDDARGLVSEARQVVVANRRTDTDSTSP